MGEPSIGLLTPTWRGDLGRFQLLRESLTAFGIDWPHVAIVQTEDAEALRAMRLPGVEIRTTAEVLPGNVEARRVARLQAPGGRNLKKWQRSLNKRLGWFPSVLYDGWHVQQITKLQAAADLPYDIIVSIDSDVVVTRPFGASEFVRDGKHALMEEWIAPERVGEPVARWYRYACQLLDLAPPADGSIFNYVAHPFVFVPKVARALHEWLERRHGRPWHEVLMSQKAGTWSEFMIYGLFARHHWQMDGLFTSVANARTLWVNSDRERINAERYVEQAFAPGAAFSFLVLQADRHWPVEKFAPLVRRRLPGSQPGR